jgi:uncharacterized membrane protein YgcG
MNRLGVEMRRLPVAGRGALLFGCVLLLLLAMPWPALADEGWVVNSFQENVRVAADGSLQVQENIQVDFGGQQKHGIFRDIPVVYDYGDNLNRVYDLNVSSVTDANGRPWRYETSREGAYLQIKIGDPNVTVSGPQSYRIAYTVRGALNAFSDHDELYWNINGPWPVRTVRTEATVTLPEDGVQQVACYQGSQGSTEPCRSSSTANTASFAATRALPEGEQLTVVVGFAKGLVPEPQPLLEQRTRDFPQFFTASNTTLGGAAFVLVLAVGAILWAWWRWGRDRRYKTLYYLTDDPSEETRSLRQGDPIVVEFSPPDKLHPGQLGLILDESADTLDVTATTIDLAVRGYLRIAEVKDEGLLGMLFSQVNAPPQSKDPKEAERRREQAVHDRFVKQGAPLSLFAKRDWELTRTDKPDADLLPYERTVLNGLFAQGTSIRLLALKTKFYKYLSDAKNQLYEDGMSRGWFVIRPDRARLLWALGGVALLTLGVVGTVLLGLLFGAGLVALPVVLAGLLLLVLSPSMPKRTAQGSEALRRTLGFRQYVATAETDRQRFNEAANLFSEYLPYAIVFHCVDKWARAFRDVDTAAATSGWYVGAGSFAAVDFSRDLQSFSAAVSTTSASTPGGSGSSGFGGGGFSGGGGGGGGGGSW